VSDGDRERSVSDGDRERCESDGVRERSESDRDLERRGKEGWGLGRGPALAGGKKIPLLARKRARHPVKEAGHAPEVEHPVKVTGNPQEMEHPVKSVRVN
jgi:hypothetical protein